MKYIFALLVFAIGQLLVVTGYLNDYLFSTLTTLCINIILAVSLNLITGFTGQFSLGHAGFMSIGGYVCALISMRIPTVPGFLLGVLTGALAAALVGFIVGLPTLRLKGDYLAIATLGMAEIIRIIFFKFENHKRGCRPQRHSPICRLDVAFSFYLQQHYLDQQFYPFSPWKSMCFHSRR